MSEELKEELKEKSNVTTKEESKVWSDDYVKSLRDEAKENRLKLKATEKLLKASLGLSDDEEVTEEKITAKRLDAESKINEALSKSKELILKASIKNLEGYDVKLVNKLLDRNSIQISDDGEVIGLEDAVNKLSEEFPAIKKVQSVNIPNNPASKQNTELQQLEEQLTLARQQGNTTLVIALKNKIFGLSK
jgi:hypothetical protein